MYIVLMYCFVNKLFEYKKHACIKLFTIYVTYSKAVRLAVDGLQNTESHT